MIVSGLLWAGTLVHAQTSGVTTLIFPPPQQAFEQLKQFLNLSDAQVDQLRAILTERDKATQEARSQIGVKQRELNELLESDSTDAVRVGQLTIDIRALLKKLPISGDQWREKALAVLTPEQRTKLVTLDQVMKLSPTANQAVQLLLIDPPPPGPPVILRAMEPAQRQ
jgi:Spy/CpxP family protein refolding chaperone